MKSLVWVHVTGVLALAFLAIAVPASAQFEIYASVAPPALPVYDQPEIPGPGYLWTPGYWAWDDFDEDYFWVPGTWVMAPQVGLYWTPGYWGWDSDSDRYGWNPGYWGPTVGFYGGIDYGFGYTGNGYEGGEWRGQNFYYNRPVNNFGNKTISNFYEKQVQHNRTVNNLSYNGPNGVSARPTPQQEAARRGRHIAPVSSQIQHEQAARSNLDLRAARNHGKPSIAATARPGEFTRGVVPAKAAQPSMQREQPQQQAQPGRQRGQPEKQAQHQQQAQPNGQHEQPQQQFQQARLHQQPQQQGESKQKEQSGKPRKKRPGER
jgi:hypothetical protein